MRVIMDLSGIARRFNWGKPIKSVYIAFNISILIKTICVSTVGLGWLYRLDVCRNISTNLKGVTLFLTYVLSPNFEKIQWIFHILKLKLLICIRNLEISLRCHKSTYFISLNWTDLVELINFISFWITVHQIYYMVFKTITTNWMQSKTLKVSKWKLSSWKLFCTTKLMASQTTESASSEHQMNPK